MAPAPPPIPVAILGAAASHGPVTTTSSTGQCSDKTTAEAYHSMGFSLLGLVAFLLWFGLPIYWYAERGLGEQPKLTGIQTIVWYALPFSAVVTWLLTR
jgi:hypothetical protein